MNSQLFWCQKQRKSTKTSRFWNFCGCGGRTRLNCGCNQFLNWLLQQSTGLLHLDGFSSCTIQKRKEKSHPDWDDFFFSGISHVILPDELLREKNATQNCRALHSLFHQGRFESCLHNNTTAIGYKNWLRRQALNLRCPGYESLFFDNAR